MLDILNNGIGIRRDLIKKEKNPNQPKKFVKKERLYQHYNKNVQVEKNSSMSSGLTYYFASQSLMVNFGKPYISKMSFMNNENTKSSRFFNMEDFKSISLCKCIYKLIAKIITNMIRGIFSTIVSSDQFGLTYYFASQSLMVNFGKPYIWKCLS